MFTWSPGRAKALSRFLVCRVVILTFNSLSLVYFSLSLFVTKMAIGHCIREAAKSLFLIITPAVTPPHSGPITKKKNAASLSILISSHVRKNG